MKVALVVMPFAAADRPSLAAGLLKAALAARGIACDTKYFNLTFWRLVGNDTYHFLAQESAATALAGEWAFSQAYWDEPASDWERYRREVLDHPIWGIPPERHHHIRRAAEAAPAFLRLVLASNDWGAYDLVGFTSTFEQTLPGLWLAREIRRRWPWVTLAAGGANFEAGLGRPYAEAFDFLDFVSTGEAETTLPELCESLAAVKAGRLAPEELRVPPGYVYRDPRDGSVKETPHRVALGGPGRFTSLDELPTPQYDDYFRVLGAGYANGFVRPNGSEPARLEAPVYGRSSAGRPPASNGERPLAVWLPVEASRGCWWGQISHCTFCGLNGDGMGFRKKSWRRVVAETDELAARHGLLPLQFTDNILGMSYFDDLIPHWASRPTKSVKFFEVKSNLKRNQIRTLFSAGVTSVQAGVESFSDETLKLMGKGVTGAQNLALVRWCAEAGIRAFWNVIFGFPKESPTDYERTLRVLAKATHLPPPAALAPIRLDRFSPNFLEWERHGFSRVEPLPAYRHVYPFSEELIGRLAYSFDYDHERFPEVLASGARLIAFGRLWREKAERGENGELAVKRHYAGGHVLVDSRFNGTPAAERLDSVAWAALLSCDAPTSRERALERGASFLEKPDRGALDAALSRFVALGVIAEVGTQLVTLALLPEEVPDGPFRRAS